MGKSPDDLPLDDQPLRPAQPVDARKTAWYQFVQEIADLLASGDYDWASGTLTGIQQSVEQYQSVTEGQRRAVRNIAGARKRVDEWGKRRYEGFSRRGR
jgi:hypothetical protein